MTNRIFICCNAPISSPIALLVRVSSPSPSYSALRVPVEKMSECYSKWEFYQDFFGTPRMSNKIWLEHHIAITSSLVARKCPTRLSSIIFQDPKNREIYRSHVPPLPLLQGIAHLEREKHKILDDDDRGQASVNLLKRWQHQKYQCCYQGQASVNLLRDKKHKKSVSVVVMN